MKRLLLLSILVLAAASCRGNSSSGGDGKLTIAVIPKGTSHVFWQMIHGGAEKAAQELGVTVIWRGPLREDDRASQISEIEGFITRGVSGIAIAPLDEVALALPVADAQRQNIPVVVFDSGLKNADFVSFVATDNRQGGRMAGEHVARRLNGKGKALLLRYAEGHDSTTQREEGFLEALANHKGIEIVSSNQYLGADVEGAVKRGEAILSNYRTPDGGLGIDAIFCVNESTTFALMRVLQDHNWAGKVKFVGFDASDNLIKGLADGHIDALIIQDPVKMGYLAVKTLVAHIKGEKVEKRIDTGVHIATQGEHGGAGDEGTAQAGPLEVAEVNQAATAPRFQMEGVRKAFGATVAVAGVDFHVAPGEVCALVGQNGAGKSTLMGILSGALRPDAGVMRARRPSVRTARADRRAQRRRGDDSPGALARPAPDRDGEHRPRDGAGSPRSDRVAADARDGGRCPGAARSSRDSSRRARRRSVAGGAAAGRGRARPGERRPRRGARRADEQPRARRRRAALCADPPSQGAGPRHRLHLALHRRGESDLGSRRRLARRPQRGRRCDGGAAGRDHRAPDGRPRGRRSLSRAARDSPARRCSS